MIAVITIHYANCLVPGMYLTGLTTAKLLRNAKLWIFRAVTLYSLRKNGEFFFPGVLNHITEYFSGLCQILVSYLEKH